MTSPPTTPGTPLNADAVIDLLGLEPLPHEGGAFRETYRAAHRVPNPLRADQTRAASTQIYYLLRPGESSALHRVRSDEVFHHYLGDPVVQLRIDDGSETFADADQGTAPTAEIVTIGGDLARGDRPQVLAPRHIWQGAVLADLPENTHAHGYALMGCTVAPGFEWDDFELITAERASRLADALPEHRDLIAAMTPVEGRTRA
jgi:predicted cupin superfamily sugar epimerase